ncbi:recombinase [Clostridium perfringens]|uniref:recombinase n=1 Tax=Clostridium perfringens TaxID=1502 RepID=UPI001ABB24CB|nr:recombinase [Clostridium perfringens]MBO3426921.1 recombinase [Clostridium perfringens]
MAHIPLGYKIVDGCAVVDELTVEQIKATYRYYFEGKSLVDAAKEAGFKMNHATVKRMLSNKKYLGTDYYPQIIDEETIERFLEELTRRAGNLGRLDRKCKERNTTIPISFRFKPAELTFADPFEQAEYIYSLIESEE